MNLKFTELTTKNDMLKTYSIYKHCMFMPTEKNSKNKYLNNNICYNSVDTQKLVAELQNFITENYNTCTKEILMNLGKMYVSDERFKINIDKHSVGTAE